MRFIFATSLTAIAMTLSACGGSNADTTPTETPTETSADQSAAAEAPAPADAPKVVKAPEGSRAADVMALGDPDAPLTIVEYASVTCPGCAGFHAQILPEIKEKYIDTGKVRMEFREFPTNPQNLAYAGFYLARCAATTKGAPAYFKMLDILFERQREWAYGPTPGETLQGIAAQVGIDKDGLEDCFYREDIKEAVRANVTQGMEDGIQGTPTFTVDGEEFDWDRRSETMDEAIERALAKLD